MSFCISTLGGGRDPRLDTHRTATPIDHPDLSITRAKLEYATTDVCFTYLAAIGKTKGAYRYADLLSVIAVTADVFADKAVDAWVWDKYGGINARHQNYYNFYELWLDSTYAAPHFGGDSWLGRVVGGSGVILATEGVDIPGNTAWLLRISISGSAFKGYRDGPATPSDTATTLRYQATDTTFASGYWGPRTRPTTYGNSEAYLAWLRASSSPGLQAIAVLEVDIEGSGKPDDPYGPSLSRNLVEISTLTGLPDFLYQETKKYEALKAKGFTDDEIRILLGYVPKHQINLDAISWGAFELHPDKTSTAIITITGENPNSPKAIDRHKARAKRVFTPPKNYQEAVALYNQLTKDYPHWLAGKDNFAYQVLGWEELDLMQNIDFYHGELIEHKTHYQQLKQVPDFEIQNRLNELADKLSKATVLTDERDKHLAKIKEVNKLGW
jgi:hypothetical protein